MAACLSYVVELSLKTLQTLANYSYLWCCSTPVHRCGSTYLVVSHSLKWSATEYEYRLYWKPWPFPFSNTGEYRQDIVKAEIEAF